MPDIAPEVAPHPNRVRTGKILFLITEDWFALSHFKPLIAMMVEDAREVVVATRFSGREAEITALGARAEPFDFRRASLNPLAQAGTIRGIAKLIGREQPDIVHVVALQPMVLTSVALSMTRNRPAAVLHLTGLGFLGISQSRAVKLLRPVALRAVASVLARSNSRLIAENPDDVAFLAGHGARADGRTTIVGGAGLDPARFPEQPWPTGGRPVAAFVGRMIRSKGVEHLVAAHEKLRNAGLPLDLALYGKTDPDNPESLSRVTVEQWAARDGITWHGHVADIASVWRAASIAVLPAITREGMPRSVLEAAASGRPLIVTDVPGCRHFVRDGIEGFVVPPADPQALADALAKLVTDRALAKRMGAAARARFLGGFTVDKVVADLRGVYRSLDHAD